MKFRKHKNKFAKSRVQIQNINDFGADLEHMKNNVDRLVDDVSLIRMAQYFVYHDTRKLKKQVFKPNKKKESTESELTESELELQE